MLQADLFRSWVTVGVLFKICFDQKLLQLLGFLISIAKRNTKMMLLRCVRVKRALKQLVVTLRVNNKFRSAKKALVNATAKMVDRMAGAYLCYGAQKSELSLAGRRGLLAAVNRFDFLSGYRFSAYAKLWVKYRLLELALRGIGRTSVVLSNAYTGGAVKFKKLSLDYCANGSSFHDVVAAETRVFGSAGTDLAEAVDCLEREEMARSALIGLVMLPAKEARIVRLRGMADFQTKMSLKQIGFELGLTKERVRQLALRASGRLLKTGAFPLYDLLAETPV